MKAILVLFFAAEIVNATKVSVMQRRIDDLEGQRIIYSARLANWQDRAIQDEEVIDQLQTAANEKCPAGWADKRNMPGNFCVRRTARKNTRTFAEKDTASPPAAHR